MLLFGVQAVYVKDNILIAEYDKHIPLFNLKGFSCEKYLNSVHDPEDEVQYFAQWVIENIPDKEKCITYLNT